MPARPVLSPTMPDYERECETFSWARALRAFDGLPSGGLRLEIHERDYPRLAALGTAIDYLVEHASAETRG